MDTIDNAILALTANIEFKNAIKQLKNFEKKNGDYKLNVNTDDLEKSYENFIKFANKKSVQAFNFSKDTASIIKMSGYEPSGNKAEDNKFYDALFSDLEKTNARMERADKFVKDMVKALGKSEEQVLGMISRMSSTDINKLVGNKYSEYDTWSNKRDQAKFKRGYNYSEKAEKRADRVAIARGKQEKDTTITPYKNAYIGVDKDYTEDEKKSINRYNGKTENAELEKTLTKYLELEAILKRVETEKDKLSQQDEKDETTLKQILQLTSDASRLRMLMADKVTVSNGAMQKFAESNKDLKLVNPETETWESRNEKVQEAKNSLILFYQQELEREAQDATDSIIKMFKEAFEKAKASIGESADTFNSLGNIDESIRKYIQNINTAKDAEEKLLEVSKKLKGSNGIVSSENIEYAKEGVGYLSRYIALGGDAEELYKRLPGTINKLFQNFRNEQVAPEFLGQLNNVYDEVQKAKDYKVGFTVGNGKGTGEGTGTGTSTGTVGGLSEGQIELITAALTRLEEKLEEIRKLTAGETETGFVKSLESISSNFELLKQNLDFTTVKTSIEEVKTAIESINFQAMSKEAETAIQSMSKQFETLGETIANSIKSGVASGTEEIEEEISKVSIKGDSLKGIGYHATKVKGWSEFDFEKTKAAKMGSGMYMLEKPVKENLLAFAKQGEVKEVELSLEKCFVLTKSYISSISDINEILGTTLPETAEAKQVLSEINNYNRQSKGNSDNFRAKMLKKGYQGFYVGDYLANVKNESELVVYDPTKLTNMTTHSKADFKSMDVDKTGFAIELVSESLTNVSTAANQATESLQQEVEATKKVATETPKVDNQIPVSSGNTASSNPSISDELKIENEQLGENVSKYQEIVSLVQEYYGLIQKLQKPTIEFQKYNEEYARVDQYLKNQMAGKPIDPSDPYTKQKIIHNRYKGFAKGINNGDDFALKAIKSAIYTYWNNATKMPNDEDLLSSTSITEGRGKNSRYTTVIPKKYKELEQSVIQEAIAMNANNKAYMEEKEQIEANNSAIKERIDLIRQNIKNIGISPEYKGDYRMGLTLKPSEASKTDIFNMTSSMSQEEMIKEICNMLGIEIPKNAEKAKQALNEVKNVSTQTNTSSPTQIFDNELQQNLVMLENYKNTVKEIDSLKLQPETEETKAKIEELNKLADYFVSKITVLESENGATISPAGLFDSYGRPNKGKDIPIDKLKEIRQIGSDKDGLVLGSVQSEFSGITTEIEQIEAKSESLRQSLTQSTQDSNNFAKNIKHAFTSMIAAQEELKTETSAKWIEAFNKDIDNALAKFPELLQFKDRFTTEESALKFVKTDEWNDFLATLPQAHQYLESIGYDFGRIKKEQPSNKNGILSDSATSSSPSKLGVTKNAPIVETDNSQEITREQQALTSLGEYIGQVIKLVNEKTAAFEKEQQVVDGSVQREITALTELSGWLISVKEDIDKIATAIKDIPTINVKTELNINKDNIIDSVKEEVSLAQQIVLIKDSLGEIAQKIKEVDFNTLFQNGKDSIQILLEQFDKLEEKISSGILSSKTAKDVAIFENAFKSDVTKKVEVPKSVATDYREYLESVKTGALTAEEAIEKMNSKVQSANIAEKLIGDIGGRQEDLKLIVQEVEKIIITLKEGNTVDFNPLKNLLANDFSKIESVTAEYDKIRKYLSKSQRAIYSGTLTDIPKDDYRSVMGTIGLKAFSKNSGSDADAFINEMNSALGTTIKVADNASDSLMNLYNYLKDSTKAFHEIALEVLDMQNINGTLASFFNKNTGYKVPNNINSELMEDENGFIIPPETDDIMDLFIEKTNSAKQAQSELGKEIEKTVQLENQENKVKQETVNIPPQTDNTQKILGENSALGTLSQTLEKVIRLVNDKTTAFVNEGTTVDSAVQKEVAALNELDGWLQAIKREVDLITAAIANLPSINVKVDLSGLDSTKLSEEVIKKFSELSKTLNSIDTSNISADGISALNGLNVSKTAGDNLQKVANAITNIKVSLNNLGDGGKSFIEDIKEIVNAGEALKNFNEILKKTKTERKEAAKQATGQSEDKPKTKTQQSNELYGAISVKQKENIKQMRNLLSNTPGVAEEAQRIIDANNVEIKQLEEKIKQQNLFNEKKEAELQVNRDNIAIQELNIQDQKAQNSDKESWIAVNSIKLKDVNLNEVEKLGDDWKIALQQTAEYKDVLGECYDITKQIRRDSKGNYLESYRLTGEKGSVVLGRDGTYLHSNMKVSSAYSDKKQEEKMLNDAYAMNADYDKKKAASSTKDNRKEIIAQYNKLISLEKELTTLRTRQQAGIGSQYDIDKIEQEIARRKEIIENLKQTTSYTQKETDAQTEYNNKVKELQELFNTNSKALGNSQVTDFINRLGNINVLGLEQNIQDTYTQIGKLTDKFSEGKITVTDYQKQVGNLVIALENVKKVIEPNNINLGKSELEQYFAEDGAQVKKVSTSKDGKTLTVDATKYDGVNKSLKELVGTYDLVTGKVSVFERKTSSAMNNLQKSLAAFKGKLQAVFRYLTTFVGVYEIIGAIKSGISTVIEFNTALSEMRKVSSASTATLKELQKESFNVADEVGSTALQIQKSTADFLRLGESVDEAAESAKNANMLLTVSEFENIEDATEALISLKQAYQELTEVNIIDILNKIGDNFAISTEGVATALQESASALKTAGNDMYESSALAAAGNTIVQNPDKVGAGLRTIALRLTGTKDASAELAEIGEETDNMITTQSKLRETIMNATRVASNNNKGIDILDDNGK